MAEPNFGGVLDEKRKRIAELEGAYIKTVAYLRSEEWQQKRDKTLERITIIVGVFQARKEKSSFAMGQIKEALLAIQEPLDIVVEYEGLKKYFKEIQQRTEELETSELS